MFLSRPSYNTSPYNANSFSVAVYYYTLSKVCSLRHSVEISPITQRETERASGADTLFNVCSLFKQLSAPGRIVCLSNCI